MDKKIEYEKLNIQILKPLYDLIKENANNKSISITELTIEMLTENLNFTLKDLFSEKGKLELVQKLEEKLLLFEKDIDILLYIQQIYSIKNKEDILNKSREVIYLLYPELNIIERRKYEKLISLKEELIKELFNEVLNNNNIRNRISKAKEELNEIFRGV